jgi:transcription elongation GreA/GreB family factor
VEEIAVHEVKRVWKAAPTVQMESLPTLVMLKSAVLEAILTRLDSELETLTRGARASFAAATDPDSKAENKYDTRTLEASYVARGQAQRVTEVQAARHHYAALQMTASDVVRLSSLVEIEVAGRSDHYFIGPSEGGLEIIFDGTEILLITPASPLGARLMGKNVGERITLPSGQSGIVKNIG